MRYAITPGVFGIPGSIAIPADEFTKVRSAQKHLIYFLNSEETFDLLLENYAEFESDLLRLGHRLLLFGEHGEPLGSHREINRRLANLLSSVYLYVEQVRQDLEAVYGKRTKPVWTFRRSCCKQRASLAYRAMEALRNYAQHRGFPVQAIIIKFEREDTNRGALLRAGLRLFVNVQHLLENADFNPDDKKTVEQLLTKVDDNGNVNLMPFVREYMERLCEVHESMRSRISGDVAVREHIIIAALERARASFGEDFKTFEGVKLVAGNVVPEEEDHEEFFQPVESEEIFIKYIEWRKTLEIKNRDFGKLSARYMTGHGGSD
jgi:hypothetical protein